MKKTWLMFLMCMGFSAMAAQPLTEQELKNQADGVCGASEVIDTPLPRNAGVIEAFKDALKRDSTIEHKQGLKDGECTGETIKQYNSNITYYMSCKKISIPGDATIKCAGK